MNDHVQRNASLRQGQCMSCRRSTSSLGVVRRLGWCASSPPAASAKESPSLSASVSESASPDRGVGRLRLRGGKPRVPAWLGWVPCEDAAAAQGGSRSAWLECPSGQAVKGSKVSELVRRAWQLGCNACLGSQCCSLVTRHKKAMLSWHATLQGCCMGGPA